MRYLATLLALIASSGIAAQPNPPDKFNEIFATICMDNFYTQKKIPEYLSRAGFEILPNDQAEFFLGHSPGKAWITVTQQGRFVVSLRNDSICTVFAQKADTKLVQSGFLALVDSAPEPLISRKENSGIYGPNTKDTTTLAYAWFRPEDKEQLLFVLTTSSSENVTAQAMASISLAKKAN